MEGDLMITPDAIARMSEDAFLDGQPVRVGPSEDEPIDGIGLCLSGGGYRAMLFHLGVLKRLNAANMLGRINRYSSVSGGSFTSALLGMNWANLDFDTAGHATKFDELVTDRIRQLANLTLDAPAVAIGLLA